MTADDSSCLSGSTPSPIRIVGQIYGWLEHVPYWFLALPLRVAIAWVFWASATTHLANWQTTLYMFATDYRLPFLPPIAAAYTAVAIEVTTPWLLILGLLTRPAALVLLGMTAVIEIFVYPQAWPTHLKWAAMLLVLLCRGAGALSLDHLVKWALDVRVFTRTAPRAASHERAGSASRTGR
jgi:putative oxidoreductase